MSRWVEQHAIALRDLAGLAEFLRRQNPRAALRFLKAAKATFNRLAGTPGMGSPFETDNPELVGLRCFPISGFENHLIFYRSLTGGIEVLRVLHGSRDLDRIFGGEL
jgi:toxin ParE1/3/4